MAKYTELMETQLYNMYGELDDTYDDPEEKVLEFLNDENSFPDFGTSLLSIISPDGEVIIENALTYIKKSGEENGVPLSDIASINTLKSWFNSGPRPKRGEKSRESMFALAFACRLNVEQTASLFHKAYLDRAFDCRNYKELIYYYCLKEGYSWSHAKELIDAVEISEESNDSTVYTVVLKEFADSATDDKEVIEYINNHSHNFQKKNVKSQELLNELISKAKQYAYDDLLEIKQQDPNAFEDRFKGAWTRSGEGISNNLLYNIIVDLAPSEKEKKGTTTVLKNANLRREIKNCFPEAQSLNGSNDSYEELRKTIILLFSYCFWHEAKQAGEEEPFEFDDYLDFLNTQLANAGLPELYPVNPYDWMFMYCTLTDDPLETMQFILKCAVDE